ncbi:MAG: adenylate/guanylate cyclase domain-containing protein [Actinomycetota bacterium]
MQCPSCQQDNPEIARFCLACGTALTAASAKGEERKIVSVLFADLVGFTAASETADPEDVRARLRPYHARLKELIEARGGTVEKFIGDAVVGLFGAPVAHEDDAERAVRTALRIQQAIEELNESTPGLELSARIAVNTGEVVVTLGARPELGEGMVTGDVINTASRLQSVAPVGGVAVGETTYRLTKDLFEYETLAPVAVKGKTEAVRLWWAKEARSRYGVETDQRATSPFVGRRYEKTMLENLYWRTTREQSIQLVTVTGEPGVGKTRLLGEFSDFIDSLSELVYWRQGRCLPYGEGITFWALGEIVKAQAGILESDTPTQAGDKLASMLEFLIDDQTQREWVRVRLAPLVGAAVDVDAAVERMEAFTAWLRFLEALSANRPTVLIFEDLHWADATMLEFIEHLVDWASGVPLLVLCTARPELYDAHPDWGGGKRNATTLSLSPLTADETSELIAGLLEEAELPDKLQALVLERSGGNPLYAEEFCRMLFDRGVLSREGGKVQLIDELEVSVPDSIQALIAARLDTVPPARKALIQDAAVVGKVFWSGALAAIGEISDEDARTALHELARREIVRPARVSSVKDQAEYAFWHVLVRDVAYGQIPRPARVRKHRAAAEWIEQTGGDRVADHAELLAYHYEQAVDLARASGLGEEIRPLEQQARRFLELAGDRARPLDSERAARYYSRALELADDDDPRRIDLVNQMAWAVSQTGAVAALIPILEKEADGFRARGDDVAHGVTLVRLGVAIRKEGSADGLAMVQSGMQLLEGKPPSPYLAQAFISAAGSYLLSGDPQRAIELAERAIEMGTALDLDSVVGLALGYRGAARCDQGDPGGIEDLRRALAVAIERGETDYAGNTFINLGDPVWMNEGPEAGLKIHRECIDYCTRRGGTANGMWATAETTWMLFDSGDWDAVIRATDEVVAWVEQTGTSQTDAVALPFKAMVLVLRGDVAGSSRLLQELMPRSSRAVDPQLLCPALIAAALWELTAGNNERALALAKQFVEVGGGVPVYVCWQLTDATRIFVENGDLDAARKLVESARPSLTRELNQVVSARAILAEAEGRDEEALTLYLEAADLWSRFPFPLEEGYALAGGARCARALSRDDEARAYVERARSLFATLGALPLIADVDAISR